MLNRSLILALAFLVAPVMTACNTDAGGSAGSEESGEAGSESGGGSEVGDLVDIPAGEFQMGCDEATVADCVIDEIPMHLVSMSAFQIDRTEVTVAAYNECFEAGACTAPSSAFDLLYCTWEGIGLEQHPVNCLVRQQAIEYCAFRDRRLPTEAEWEYAARGQTGRLYPWGDADPSCTLANTSFPEPCEDPWMTRPVGSNPSGASAFGVQDMGGNVEEMVSDWYQQEYYAASPLADPQGPASGDPDPLWPEYTQVVTRGGSFRTDEERWLRASDRVPTLVETAAFVLGFRCAKG